MTIHTIDNRIAYLKAEIQNELKIKKPLRNTDRVNRNYQTIKRLESWKPDISEKMVLSQHESSNDRERDKL